MYSFSGQFCNLRPHFYECRNPTLSKNPLHPENQKITNLEN